MSRSCMDFSPPHAVSKREIEQERGRWASQIVQGCTVVVRCEIIDPPPEEGAGGTPNPTKGRQVPKRNREMGRDALSEE